MKRTLLLTLSVLVLSAVTVSAQEEKPAQKDHTHGWYVGAQAGMPMAEADFSSFGADKFRPGWSAGIHAGYRFTRVWSLEMTANWGQQFLAEQDCCFERGYWLGNDHKRYHPELIPAGMDGWYYKDLKSRTFVQRYGLQVNMNVLGFFNRTKDSRWRFELSPAVYAVGTSSDLFTKADNALVAENLNDWHLGYGGRAQVSYAIADNMNIGIYGGFTHLTGNPMDGMPELHTTNFIVDAGVKFSFAFGAKSKVGKRASAVVPATVAMAVAATEQTVKATEEVVGEQPVKKSEEVAAVPVQEATDSAAVATATPTEVVAIDTTTVKPTEVIAEQPKDTSVILSDSEESVKQDGVTDSSLQSSTSVQNDIVNEADSQFPVIYFSFNSIWIEPSERAKVKEIADMMKADKSIRIRVTGWGDEIGGEQANKRVSLQRAEAVKRVLGQWLIPAERIETVGAGINHNAATAREARNATTIEIVE